MGQPRRLYYRQDNIQMLMGFCDLFRRKKKEKLEPTSEPAKEEPTSEPSKEEPTSEPAKEEPKTEE